MMKQALSPLVTPHNNNQEPEGRDQIAFWLTILMLLLLPIERIILPSGLRVADFVLVLLTLYSLGKAWHTHQRLDFPLLLPMWLTLLSSLFAALMGFASSDNIIAIVQEIYLFTWFIVLTNTLKVFSPSDQDRLMKIWSVIACAEAVTTLMGMLRIGPSIFYISPYHERSNIRTRFSRGLGTYANANAAAVYLSISFFVSLATSWPIWLRSVLGMWLFAGMFGTGSNGALFSTLGSLVVLVVVHSIIKDHRATMVWGTVLGVGLGVTTVILFIPGLLPSLLSGFGLDTSEQLALLTLGRFSNSLKGRLALIKRTWQIYSLHPWGTGPNSFTSLGLSLHNDYVAFLFERGPVGAIGWLWIVGATLFAPLRAAHQLADRHQRWRVLALGASFFACAINAFSHEVSHMRQVWMLMVFLFALSCAQLTQQATSSPSSIGPDKERNGHDLKRAEPSNWAAPVP